MKFNTSFSSLPTGAHLYRKDVDEGRFVFYGEVEKNQDAMNLSKTSMNETMKDLNVFGPTVEMGELKSDVESKEKVLTKEYLTAKSDVMRAEVERLAIERLEKEFEKLTGELDSKLTELFEDQVEADPKRTKTGDVSTQEVKEWLEKKTTKEKEIMLARHQLVLANVIEKNSWFEKVILRYESQTGKQKNIDQSVKTRTGNALGMGLTSLYIMGIIKGAESNSMWYTGLAAGAGGALVPGFSADVLRIADTGLDTLGAGVDSVTTHVKDFLLGVARQDVSIMWDGKTDINESREEIVDTLYNGKSMRPTLQMEVEREEENGEMIKVQVDMIDETMHERFLNPIAMGGEEREPLTKEQTEGAAQFCVEVFDPNIILTSENITPAQKQKLAHLMRGAHVRFDTWDKEDLQLLSRVFATREAVLAWNYYMIHSSTGERDDFAEAFAQKWEAKKLRRRGQLPVEIEAEVERTLSELNSGINGSLKEMSPEGIASFMKEGGLEDLLVALGVVMAAIYSSVGIGYLAKKGRDKWNERNSLSKVEKSLNKRRKAKENLSNVLNKPEMKSRDWKNALKYLYKMGVIHLGEREGLRKLSPGPKTSKKGVSTGGWNSIIKKMKSKRKNKKTFLENVKIDGTIESEKKMQDSFWDCVTDGNSTKKARAEIGILESSTIEKGKKIELTKRKQSRIELVLLQNIQKNYEASLKDMGEAYSQNNKFWQLRTKIENGGRKAKVAWKKFEEWGEMNGKRIDVLKIFSNNEAIYSRLLYLGVHGNAIDLLKSMPKKGGKRKTAIYDKIKEVLAEYPQKYTTVEQKYIDRGYITKSASTHNASYQQVRGMTR